MAKDKTPAADGGPTPEVAARVDPKATGQEPASQVSAGHPPGKAAPEEPASGNVAFGKPAGPAKRLPWFRLTVIVLFALVYAWDLFEAISDLFGVAAQITTYNENATLIGLNTITIPWTVLIINLLLPPVVFGLALLITRRRNVGILAIVLVAGLGVVAALSLSLAELVGILS